MVDDDKEDVTQFVVKHAPALRSLSAKHVANLYDDVMVMSGFSPTRSSLDNTQLETIVLGGEDDASFAESQRFNLVQTPALKTVAFGERAFDAAHKLSIPSTAVTSLAFGKDSWARLEVFDFSGGLCHKAFTVGFANLQSLTIQTGALASLQAMAIRAFVLPPLRIESPVLTAFTTMSNTLGEVASLSISNAKALRTVHIGDNCFNKAKAFTLSDAEVLEAFEVGDHCFQQVKEFDLSCGLFSLPSLVSRNAAGDLPRGQRLLPHHHEALSHRSFFRCLITPSRRDPRLHCERWLLCQGEPALAARLHQAANSLHRPRVLPGVHERPRVRRCLL